MPFTKRILASLALFCTVGTASAVTSVDFVAYTVSYDETTTFGGLSGAFNAGGGATGFSWTVPNTAQVASFGPLTMVTIALPSFTISANAGWSLSGASGFLGNLIFTEVGAATTQIVLNADVSVNGGAPVVLTDNVDWTATSGGGGYLNGYFSETWGLSGAFNTLSVSNASIVLSATGGVFSSIAAQPQNRLEIRMIAMPVPEPETGAMLLAGLGALAWLGARRQRG